MDYCTAMQLGQILGVKKPSLGGLFILQRGLASPLYINNRHAEVSHKRTILA
jgi:orotate phosphoribosyltransferase